MKLREITEQAADHGHQLTIEAAAAADQIASSDPAVVGALLRSIHTVVLRAGEDILRQVPPQSLTKIARSITDQTPNRSLLLQLLAMIRSPESLSDLIQLPHGTTSEGLD